jgi:hypothetical protein
MQPESFDKKTIKRLIARLRDRPAEAEAGPPGPRALPLFGWDNHNNPSALLERHDERVLIARLLPVVDQRLPAGTDLVDLQVRWKPISDVRLDDARTPQIRNWLAETVYLALLAAHLVKASPQQAGTQLTFRTPYLAWWRFGTLLITQTHPIVLGVSPEVVSGTSYAGLAWYARSAAGFRGAVRPACGPPRASIWPSAPSKSRAFSARPGTRRAWPEISE